MKLDSDFYLRPDVVQVANDLLGKLLITSINGVTTSGIIVETEAYAGIRDRASHAFGGRYSQRTKTMYEQGGISYIYLCYGIHHLFNVVTNMEGKPDAVLIRAVEPVEGIKHMLLRRNLEKTCYNISNGPGILSQALGITRFHDNTPLTGSTIWIADEGVSVQSENVISSPRVGVGYAGVDAALPYRFRIKDNPWTSKAK